VATFQGTQGTPGTSTASIAVTVPTHQAGDLILIAVGGKYAATASTPTGNNGFVSIRATSGGTVTTGNDAGDSFLRVFGKVATSGSETFTVTAGPSPAAPAAAPSSPATPSSSNRPTTPLSPATSSPNASTMAASRPVSSTWSWAATNRVKP
jgi:hypothetical protein